MVTDCTWSRPGGDVDSVIAADGDGLIGVIIRVVCEHLQYRKEKRSHEHRSGNMTEDELTVSQPENTDHSPGFSWSLAEWVSTLWKTNEQRWRIDWQKQKGDESEGKNIPTWTHPRCWHTGWRSSLLRAEPRWGSPWDYSPAESHLQSHFKGVFHKLK